ncbi:hypothetical protein LTR62_008316 [Meristemomyces frigidus]|uniref:CHY-type domain-containing protein n=1 Tax=Meristemomyces frigidus TaxID=1508187 RepID=A0AAN7TI53_9PEZI|nr:hypothetical protein LTR62_008316 [Meristemomyces frigidus]
MSLPPHTIAAEPPTATDTASPSYQNEKESQLAAPVPLRQADVVLRPTPRNQTDNPRAFQIGQIERRFRPQTTQKGDASLFTFGMKPSDPDFPYEIEELLCVLTVPRSYPAAKPSLQVTNQDIPRGFQLNIERGLDMIAASNTGATLLGLMNRLDRDLEMILAGKIAETIKIVPNRSKVVSSELPTNVTDDKKAVVKTDDIVVASPVITDAERAAAKLIRQAHYRQLVARFGNLQSFVQWSDGLSFTLPLDSPRKARWPASLRNLRSFKLLVPEAYPLEPANITLESESTEARNVERACMRLPELLGATTLTQLANHLAHHLSDMAAATHEPEPEETPPVVTSEPKAAIPALSAVNQEPEAGKVAEPSTDNDKPRVHFIPRPPEWSQELTGGEDSGDDTYSESSTDEEEIAEQQEKGQSINGPSRSQERGVLLSFPHLELHGIELLELTLLNISVKCERCKDTTDLQKLRNYSGNVSDMQQVTCEKCANVVAVGFRAELMHVNAARAGYLDLEGCTVADMLPSNFIPTCAECSTAYPAPGVVAVRGDSSFAVCRECHRKMTFRIPEAKFLQISASAVRSSRALGRRKVKENLGISAGTELPRRGRCKHYGKSYRWFRGYCSREQNYRPEDCGICHAVLIGKRGSGFWEGGKGTRDATRMSRKDPRKYKRR